MTEAVKVEPKGQRVQKEITFKLSQKDFAAKAEEMAKLDGEISALEQERKQKNAELQTQINERETSRHKISGIVREKAETLEVTATMVKNFEMNIVTFWVKNEEGLWAVAEERAMDEQERQTEMDLVAHRATADAKKVKATKGKKAKPDRMKAAAGDKDDDEREETAKVIKAETKRSTKRSAVDGPHP